MTAPGALQVRELRGLDELALTPHLARAVWGEEDGPEDPALLHVLQHIGGLVAGALDPQGRLWAYLVGLPTRSPHLQHSHRLGVHPEARRQGLGERLKRFQRTWCLERGVTCVHWTVDPLLLANAHLNIHRLGGTAGTLLPDYYGAMTGINAGVPSDRLEVEWRLDDPRVATRLAGEGMAPWPALVAHDSLTETPEAIIGDVPEALALRVPTDYYRLIREQPGQALEWRCRSRPVFQTLFQSGYRLMDADRDRQQYLFRRGDGC